MHLTSTAKGNMLTTSAASFRLGDRLDEGIIAMLSATLIQIFLSSPCKMLQSTHGILLS